MILAPQRLGIAWLPRRLQFGAVVGFAAVFALMLVAGGRGMGISQLFFVPIVFMALSGDRNLGIAAGLVASSLYATVLTLHASSGVGELVSWRVPIHVASYIAAGAIIATFASRARSLLAESLQMLDVLITLARHDVESGALSPEGLDGALGDRVARGWPFALLVGELGHHSGNRRLLRAPDGDGALRDAVRTLGSHLGPEADVARAGPSRLVVLSAATSPGLAREAATAAERVLDESGRPATFGWAFYPSEGADGLSLLQSASERLYARRIVRGEWQPTAVTAGLVDELPLRAAASG